MTTDEIIDGLYDNSYKNIFKVYEIFKDFFSEDRVDLQNIPTKEEFKNLIYETHISLIAEPSADYYESLKNYDKIKDAIIEQEKNVNECLLKSRYTKYRIDNINRDRLFVILVHFPIVTIINEYNKSTTIKDLFAKVTISPNGTIKYSFSLNRATYSAIHYMNNYMHSHISSISTNEIFHDPCLGSGPIKATINSLYLKFDEDLWKLFCIELDKYVTVESIEGTPYHKLETLTPITYKGDNTFSIYTKRLGHGKVRELLSDFVEHLIYTKKLKFNHINGVFSIAMSYIDYRVLISNEFIKWYNQKFNEKVYNYTFESLLRLDLDKVVIRDNAIYGGDAKAVNYINTIGNKICTFKGKVIRLNIEDVKEEDLNYTYLLNKRNCSFILNTILKVLNYRYGRKREESTESNSEIKYL